MNARLLNLNLKRKQKDKTILIPKEFSKKIEINPFWERIASNYSIL